MDVAETNGDRMKLWLDETNPYVMNYNYITRRMWLITIILTVLYVIWETINIGVYSLRCLYCIFGKSEHAKVFKYGLLDSWIKK